MLTTDDNVPFKYGIGTYDYVARVIELFAGEGHDISLGTHTWAGETWIELHCTLPVALRKGLRRVYYPSLLIGDRNERRRAMRGKVDRGTMYAVVYLPHQSLKKGDAPFGVPSLGALVDLLVDRRAVRERGPALVQVEAAPAEVAACNPRSHKDSTPSWN